MKIRAGGHWLAAEWVGRRAGATALVFLHEGLGSIRQWRDFPAALAEATGLPALIYDRWGYGGSDPLEGPRPASYLIDEARIALPEVLSACGVSDPVLVGHSDGGSIALIYSASHPARAVITEAAHVFVPEKALQSIRATEQSWPELQPRLERYHGANAEGMFFGWSGAWLSPEFRGFNIEALLPQISCPVLAVLGEQDEYCPPEQLEKIAAGTGGRARTLLIPGCGHAPHRQAREATLAAMTDFLKENL